MQGSLHFLNIILLKMVLIEMMIQLCKGPLKYVVYNLFGLNCKLSYRRVWVWQPGKETGNRIFENNLQLLERSCSHLSVFIP
jgi:hypothetical protein